MRVLVCTDGSGQSIKAAEKAARMVDSSDEVYIMQVYLNLSQFGMTTDSSVVSGDEIRKKREEHLNEAASKFKDKGIEPKTILKEGHPVEVILEFAKKNNIDLIAMGSKGSSGLGNVFLGSVSNSILQKADADVILVK